MRSASDEFTNLPEADRKLAALRGGTEVQEVFAGEHLLVGVWVATHPVIISPR